MVLAPTLERGTTIGLAVDATDHCAHGGSHRDGPRLGEVVVVQRIKVGKRWIAALAATPVLLGAFALTGTTSALGDTHVNCATFDSQGNIQSLTPNCSETVHVTSPPSVFPGADPCTNPVTPGTVTLNDDHSVFHVNVNGAGDAWLTGTDGGTASFVADSPSALSGQGTWTSWFGGALNRQSMVMSGTMTSRFSLSDGTHVVIHDNSHATLTPNGVTISHDNPTLSCGG